VQAKRNRQGGGRLQRVFAEWKTNRPILAAAIAAKGELLDYWGLELFRTSLFPASHASASDRTFRFLRLHKDRILL
jgi:hypothetical protein